MINESLASLEIQYLTDYNDCERESLMNEYKVTLLSRKAVQIHEVIAESKERAIELAEFDANDSRCLFDEIDLAGDDDENLMDYVYTETHCEYVGECEYLDSTEYANLLSHESR
jgi:hypothetical protein